MKKFLLGVTGALAMGAMSCEKHPLPGEPPAPMTQGAHPAHPAHQTAPVTGEQHAGAKTPDSATARDERAQPAQQPVPADPAKPAEQRKFFPEAAEKK